MIIRNLQAFLRGQAASHHRDHRHSRLEFTRDYNATSFTVEDGADCPPIHPSSMNPFLHSLTLWLLFSPGRVSVVIRKRYRGCVDVRNRGEEGARRLNERTEREGKKSSEIDPCPFPFPSALHNSIHGCFFCAFTCRFPRLACGERERKLLDQADSQCWLPSAIHFLSLLTSCLVSSVLC